MIRLGAGRNALNGFSGFDLTLLHSKGPTNEEDSMKHFKLLALAFSLFVLVDNNYAAALGTAFTYQGRLNDNAQPANASFDFRFVLFTAGSGGSQIGNTLTNEDVAVNNGLFTVELDFGVSAFTGEARWLEIAVRPGASTGSFTPLTPRPPLTPTPNALFSANAAVAATATTALGVAANSVANSGIQDGAVTAPKIGSGQVVKSLNSLKDDVNLIAGANVTLTPSGNNLTLAAGPWSSSGSNVFYTGGNVGAGTAAPGEALHVEGGSILLNSSGEREIRMRRTDLPNAPAFRLGRIVTAGDGSPEFRVLYSDAATPERPVFEFDNKGIVASVKANVGSHFEGFLAGDSEPLFRLNSFPAMQLELGAGGANLTDVKVRRAGSNTLTFVTGPGGSEIERMRVASGGNVGIGTNNPTAKLEVAGAVKATSLQGDGSAITALNGANINSGTIGDARIDGAIARDSEIVPTVLASDGQGSGLDADLLDGLDARAFWQLGGNAGTISGTHFLGTSDNQPLDFRVNNQRALRLMPTRSNDTVNVLGGSPSNLIDPGVMAATISGGGTPQWFGGPRLNSVASDFATVGGGADNRVGSNSLSGVIGGGFGNRIQNGTFDATIGGGTLNLIGNNAPSAVIAGGQGNIASNANVTIGGGGQNLAIGLTATIGGGFQNRALETDTTVSGGYTNVASGYRSTIAGGALNIASNASATVSGGQFNVAGGLTSTIAGGYQNQALNADTTIGGGYTNTATGYRSTIAGGALNLTGGDFSTVSGGQENLANPSGSTIAGGLFNQVEPNANRAVISGGNNNIIRFNAQGSGIGAGSFNVIGTNAQGAHIAGGFANSIGTNAANSTIGGGQQNTLSGTNSMIGGGDGNNISGHYCAIAGGRFNDASIGSHSAIGGGSQNTANGSYSTVPGGFQNHAVAPFSFAAGNRAKASFQGAFVWADSQSADFFATTTDEVSFRCLRGVRFTSAGAGANQTVSWVPGSASWSFSSDRSLKEKVKWVDAQSVLEKVSRLSVAEWSYKGYPQRHIGPMAQDFHALFPLNDNDRMLDSGDLHGVTLAAIQGLNKKLEEQLKEKDTRIAALEEQNQTLSARLSALEGKVGSLSTKK